MSTPDFGKRLTEPFARMMDDYVRRNFSDPLGEKIKARMEAAAGMDRLRERTSSWGSLDGRRWGDLEGRSWGDLQDSAEQVLDVAKGLPGHDQEVVISFLEKVDSTLSRLDGKVDSLHTKADASDKRANWHLFWGITVGAVIGVLGNIAVALALG
ncbi:hypothetical protein [Nocardiopsis sp. TNDT3]|uniref:hypothetical protein n=1 Tax=Nocardiopsis sp. TNDT3 TaxID=2249354 RepID=UPI0013007BF5|nr:hypothetical protein [Nocardiopsis sp. TNDT3]